METILILRPRQVFAAIGRCRTSTYDDVKNGLLPKFIKLGRRASGLPAHEVEAVNRARLAGMNDDQLRELVKQLEAARNVIIPAATPQKPKKQRKAGRGRKR